MKATKGQANPQVALKLLAQELEVERVSNLLYTLFLLLRRNDTGENEQIFYDCYLS